MEAKELKIRAESLLWDAFFLVVSSVGLFMIGFQDLGLQLLLCANMAALRVLIFVVGERSNANCEHNQSL